LRLNSPQQDQFQEAANSHQQRQILLNNNNNIIVISNRNTNGNNNLDLQHNSITNNGFRDNSSNIKDLAYPSQANTKRGDIQRKTGAEA
jgi:hypothetical protein